MASSASTCVYDIFINHRGPDSKKTLATHMYDRLSKHDLRVFLDQRELQEGDPFPSQIEGAIRTASVHIAIFSPRYAESIWCLKELVLMLESNKTIIPVFYGVQPSELRWTQRETGLYDTVLRMFPWVRTMLCRTRDENGVYARSLSYLQEKKTIDSQTGQKKPRYDSNIIAKWREALSHVANISGFDRETYNGYDYELQLLLLVLALICCIYVIYD